MKELMVTETVMDLTQNDAQTILQECVDPDTTEDRIHERLMTLIRNFREDLLTYQRQEELQRKLEIAKLISSMLRKKAQRTGNLRYYYFGIYHAKLEQIQKEFLERQITTMQQEAASRKHFASIMRILYSQQMVQQSELSKQLSVNRGNLSREMDRLVLVGFVEERKAGKYKLYNLSAQGHSYYNKYLLLRSQLEHVEQPSFRERDGYQYQIDGIIEYQEIPDEVSFRSSSKKISSICAENLPLRVDSIDYYRFINYQTDMMEVR